MLTLPGGSKFFMYSANVGVIASYDQTKNRAMLQKAFDNGQRAAGLVLQCASPMPGQQIGPGSDGLTLPSYDYAWFDQAASFFQDAAEIGYEFFAPEFVYVEGDDSMRNWTEFDQSGAARIWNLLANFRDKVMVKSRRPFRIDLAGELPTKSGVGISLAQYLWINYTASFWPEGIPCQDATISIPCATSSIPLLVSVFDGNPPDTLDVHVYDGGDEFPDAASAITGMKQGLESAGLALPWDIGETQINNPITSAKTAQGIIQTRQLVRRIYQWQGSADVSGFNHWALRGFAPA